jgi:hypothetical protein
MSDDNTIAGLRAVLFDTLRGLKAGQVKPDQAQAINDTAQTIINSAKVEVDYARVTGNSLASEFLPPATKPGPREVPAGPTRSMPLGESPKGRL